MATYVIGDVHGMAQKLDAMLDLIPLVPAEDLLIFVGDLIDRGPDSREVVERVMALKVNLPGRLVCLKGNHEDLLLNAAQSGSEEDLQYFLRNGGGATLQSYGVATPDRLPAHHLDFMRSLPCYWQDARHIVVHGGVDPHLALDDTPPQTFLWDRSMRGHARSGKTVVCGHTPQSNGVLMRDDVICIDTGACYTRSGMGVLSAINLETRTLYQV